MIHHNKFLPTLIGYRDKFDQGRVWCPFCAKWYEHRLALDTASGEINHAGVACGHFPHGYQIKILHEDRLIAMLRGTEGEASRST